MQAKMKAVAALVALMSICASGCKPGGTSDAAEVGRAEQATPQATITAMFVMTPLDTYEKINPAVIALGKKLNPDEQRVAQLGWDGERAASVYQYLIDMVADFQSFQDTNQTGDSAIVRVSVNAYPTARVRDGDEAKDLVYSFELKQRGGNWYLYELKTDHTPEGVYAAYKKRWEQIR